MIRRLSFVLFAVLLSVETAMLVGCSGSLSMPDTAATTALGHMVGRVHGGQQPIVGAHVFVLAAATGGFGGAGLAAAKTNASKSLLNKYTKGSYPTKEDTTTGDATYGDYYVTTDSAGDFELTGEYTCTEGEDIYLYTSGGNPGGGANAKATLMAVLGACPVNGTLDDLIPYVEINEVSTVAAAFAVGGFATDPLHVGDDEGVSGNSYATLAKTGMSIAFGNAAQIVDLGTGLARSKTPLGNGVVSQATINSLANSLAACINSTGSLTGGCALLSDVSADGTASGAAAADVATAAIYIAHYPGYGVSAIYSAATADAPFAPAVSAAPNDWTVGITFTGNGIDEPAALAVDAQDSVWVANFSSLEPASHLSAVGGKFPNYGLQAGFGIAIDTAGDVWGAAAQYDQALNEVDASGTLHSYTNGGIDYPQVVALSGDGEVWTSNSGPSGYSISLLSSSGAAISGSNGYTGGGLGAPSGLAVDGAGSVWAANYYQPSLSKYSRTGTAITGSAGYTGGGAQYPFAVAIDASGNAWAVNSFSGYSGNSVIEFSNSGKALSPSSGYTGGGLSGTRGIALDGAANIWVCNDDNDSITELSSSGVAISGSSGYEKGLQDPWGIAVDGAGNVWVVNINNSSLTEFLGIAAPVITPIAAGLPATPTADGSSRLGTRP